MVSIFGPKRETAKGIGTHKSDLSEGPHDYCLKISGQKGQPAKEIKFRALDSYEALAIAHKQADARPTQVWRDGQMLCEIVESKDSVWLVLPTGQA